MPTRHTNLQSAVQVGSLMLLGVAFATAGTGCAFDSTFFPVDVRPGTISTPDYEAVLLTAGDGCVIHHILLKPAGVPIATVFMLHGGGSNILRWSKQAIPLTQSGFQVFLMEYRGFGKSEGTATHENAVADGSNALVYLAARKDVVGRKLLLLGQSYGGQVAVQLAKRHHDLVDALVVEGAFTAFDEIAVYTTPWFAKPFTYLVFRNPYEAKELISRVTVPTLIIHSVDDPMVPYRMGQELYQRAREPKELWTIRGGHVDGLVDYPREYVQRLKRLLAG